MNKELKEFKRDNINLTERIYMEISPGLSSKAVEKMLASRRSIDPDFSPIKFFNLKDGSICWTLIAICIKEHLTQQLAELALRLCLDKNVPYTAAASLVRVLQKKDMLFYYDSLHQPHRWVPGTDEFHPNDVIRELLGGTL